VIHDNTNTPNSPTEPAGDLRRTTPTSSDSSVSAEATDRFTLIVGVKPNLVETRGQGYPIAGVCGGLNSGTENENYRLLLS
jgi:hypothetical protein